VGSNPTPSAVQHAWIAVVGDRVPGHEPQEAIATAIGHATDARGVDAPDVRWISTDEVAAHGAGALLRGAAGVWGAPGGPYRSLSGALDAIRWAREQRVPFLGTCAGFQHGVIEFARNVLGHERAAHAEYGETGDVELFIEELLCSLAGQTMDVDLVDPRLVALYGAATAQERYYCSFGLRPVWRQPLHDAGLEVAATDKADGDVRALTLAGHPYFVLTLFVPQTSSTPARPHPVVRGFVEAVADRQAD
jgi:CTP synthase (UTP-ammonia lyase)